MRTKQQNQTLTLGGSKAAGFGVLGAGKAHLWLGAGVGALTGAVVDHAVFVALDGGVIGRGGFFGANVGVICRGAANKQR